MGMLAELVDLVLPSHCVCCDRPGPVWCPGCRPAGRCEVIALAHGPPVYAAAEYAGGLRTALLSYKERGVRSLAGPLADYLADAVDVGPARAAGRRAAGAGAGAVQPGRRPGSAVAITSAGWPGWSARQLRLEVLPLLRLTGRVADSAGLSADQRAGNLAHRMRRPAGRSREPRPVIVVDDILTTGATLTEAQPGTAGGRLAGAGRGGDRPDPAPATPKWARLITRLNWAELPSWASVQVTY